MIPNEINEVINSMVLAIQQRSENELELKRELVELLYTHIVSDLTVHHVNANFSLTRTRIEEMASEYFLNNIFW